MASHTMSYTNWEQYAKNFLILFPIGSTLTQDQFVDWAVSLALMPAVATTDKHSDSWKASLQRRHEVRFNLNKAAKKLQFQVETLDPGTLEVNSNEVAISKSKIAARIHSLITTKKQRLNSLMMHTKFDTLPPAERVLAGTLTEDIDDWSQEIALRATQLNNKFLKLKHKLEESGQMLLGNGDDNGEDHDPII